MLKSSGEDGPSPFSGARVSNLGCSIVWVNQEFLVAWSPAYGGTNIEDDQIVPSFRAAEPVNRSWAQSQESPRRVTHRRNAGFYWNLRG